MTRSLAAILFMVGLAMTGCGDSPRAPSSSAPSAAAPEKSAGKADQVKIIAFDGQLIGKQAIRDGKIVCDPIQFPDRIGRVTIEQIHPLQSKDRIRGCSADRRPARYVKASGSSFVTGSLATVTHAQYLI